MLNCPPPNLNACFMEASRGENYEICLPLAVEDRQNMGLCLISILLNSLCCFWPINDLFWKTFYMCTVRNLYSFVVGLNAL